MAVWIQESVTQSTGNAFDVLIEGYREAQRRTAVLLAPRPDPAKLAAGADFSPAPVSSWLRDIQIEPLTIL